MFEKLEDLIKNSKSLYYNYPVAAIIECIDGTCYNGVNIETSSPAAGICAERCALFSSLIDNKTKDDYKTLYVLNNTEKSITPCFICRQALIDYCYKDLEIVSYNKNGEKRHYILEDLCPEIFGEDNLK